MSKKFTNNKKSGFFYKVIIVVVAVPLFLGQVLFASGSTKLKSTKKILICSNCKHANYLVDNDLKNNVFNRKCSHCQSITQHFVVKATKSKLLDIQRKQDSARKKALVSARNSSATKHKINH